MFGSLVVGVDKLSSKPRTDKRLIDLQDFNSLSKSKVALLKVRWGRGGRGGVDDSRQRSVHDKPKNA